jgi:uncharacterized protein
MSNLRGFFRHLLRFAAGVICRWPGFVAGLGIALTLWGGWYTWHNFKSVNNIGALLDDKSPVNRTYLQYKKEFNVDEEYILVINSNDAVLNRHVADELASRLDRIKPGIRTVFYKFDFSKIEKRFLLFQSPGELLQIEKDVSSYANALKTTKVNFDVNSMLDQANRAMGNETYLRKKENWKDFKPFVDRFASMLGQLAERLEDKQRMSGGELKMDAQTDFSDPASQDVSKLVAEKEYISYDHGRTVLVMATPGQREKNSASPYSETLKEIRGLISEMHAQYPGVNIGLTGEPVLNDDEMQTATKDATYASILTFILILVTFAISYREYARPGLAIAVLLMAVVWCFAATMLLVGHLNIITQAFVPMVLGLGIDFGIQIMGRYEEELGHGLSIQDALTETLQHTGVAIITGGSTTAVAFYTMCFNDFKGLSELGVICGTSMLLCMAANIILLPAFYVLRDRKRKTADLYSPKIAAESHFAPSFNAGIVRYPYAVIGAGVALTILSVYGATRVSFDYNLLNLQNQKLESVRVENAMLKKLGNSSIYATVTVDSLDQARELSQRLEALPSVKEVQSIASVLPDRQEEKLPIIRRIVGSLKGVDLDTASKARLDAEKARQDVAHLLKSSKEAEGQAKLYAGVSRMASEAVGTFQKLIPPLQRADAAMQKLDHDELSRRLDRYQTEVFGNMEHGLAWLSTADTRDIIQLDDVPPQLRERFIGNTGKLLLQIYAKGDLWDRGPLVEFVHDVQSVAPDATGTPVQNYVYIDLLRTSYSHASVWAFAAIALLIALHFRNLRDYLLAMLPLALGVLWTVGVMGLFHIQFNPANIMTLPMILGIGVAYGVYTTDRFREVGKMEIFSTSTGKAIILSALTTIYGFASMLISDYRGLFSMGLVMTLGVSFCLLASLGLLPQILKLLEPEAKGNGAKSGEDANSDETPA